GTVTAKSGAEVWELFQIRDWRGGTATSGMADNTQKVFPMNQYYVQNIEAALTLEAGATEKVYTAINASKQAFSASTTFIGTDGMFQIVNGSLTKSFVGASDRLQIDVDGEFKINPMSLKIAGIPLIGNLNLNTTDYTLPINSNISINIKSGNSTIAQDVAFFPGSELTIAEGATITLAKGHKAYIYDQDNWGAYAGAGLHLVPVGYSVANGTTAKRTNASLVDAKIDINGTMIVAGEAYTTAGGAQIISSEGTGVYDQQAAPGTETKTYQATQSGSDISYADIPITAAKLQNADGSYVETADMKAGTDIPYVGGVWGDNTPATYTVTWLDIEDGTLLQSSEVKDGEHPVYTGETPTKADDGMYTYSFDKWMIAETGEEYTDATVVSGEDMTIYSTFTATRKTLTVTFHANNGTDATATQTLNTVEKKALDANPFTYPSYQFLGWATSASGEKVYDDKQAVEFDGDVDLYAVWERAAITVTFDANVKEGTVYGEMEPQTISVNGEKLTANAFDRFGYDFIGWNTQADGKGVDYADESLFSGDTDITLYAQWQAKTYTITWVNWNGDLLEKDENVPFGSDPSYDGADPIRPDTESKHYTFSGWNPDVVPVDGDKEYKANFTESDITYTLTFSPNAADAEGAMEPQTVKGGVNVRVNEPGYTRTGYDFIAWNTEADGSGTPYDVVGGY
ncbi:MAG: InlB B-repeat-containing protein, partial [Oscillospiraceae bacterium]|nr:InlB B-repeat-containing protein [Oscillospiraceae bacterium]